jgi:hypothetical protein
MSGALGSPGNFLYASELTDEVSAAIDDCFEYHPWTPEQQEAGKAIRVALANIVKMVIVTVPPGPDRTTAIRKLREARMDVNSAITHGGKY